MRKLTFFLFLTLFLNLRAQEYDLNNYKYRFQKYRYAFFNLNFQGNNDYLIRKYTYKTPFFDISETIDRNAYSLQSSLPFRYSKTINTERLQHTERGSFQIDFSKNNSLRNTFSEFYSNLNYENNNRFYKDLNFTELNFAMNGRHYNSKWYYDNNNSYFKGSTGQFTGDYQINVGKGKGRLEYVTDAVSAMFLLRDLKKKAGIGNYTIEQTENIARGITKIRNMRFIDFRFRLIDQLTLLDSTLKNNGIKPDNDIRYFTTINDNWLYATNFQRFSGKRWSVNYINSGMFYKNSRMSKNADTSAYDINTIILKNINNGVSLNYNVSQQKGLFVQQNSGVSIGAGINLAGYSFWRGQVNSNNAPDKHLEDNTQYYINLNWGYLFQPNTRTYITFDLNLNSKYSQMLYGLRTGNPNNRKQYTFTNNIIPSLSVFKFFSPKFYYSLRVDSNFELTKSKYSELEFTGLINQYQYTNFSSNYRIPLSVTTGFTYTFF